MFSFKFSKTFINTFFTEHLEGFYTTMKIEVNPILVSKIVRWSWNFLALSWSYEFTIVPSDFPQGLPEVHYLLKRIFYPPTLPPNHLVSNQRICNYLLIIYNYL